MRLIRDVSQKRLFMMPFWLVDARFLAKRGHHSHQWLLLMIQMFLYSPFVKPAVFTNQKSISPARYLGHVAFPA